MGDPSSGIAPPEKKPERKGTFSKVYGQKKSLEDIFARAALKYQVPEKLLKAVAKAESGFDPRAVSHAGAKGIMQLMPQTAKGVGVTDPFDPERSIMGGAKILGNHLKTYGDVDLALAAYNAGPGNVARYGGIPPFGETQNYIRKIKGFLGEEISVVTTDREPKRSPSRKENLFGNAEEASHFLRLMCLQKTFRLGASLGKLDEKL